MVAPKLRFKEFDGDWSRYKIAEVTEYLVDGTHFSPKTTEGEFKYITSKNIRNDGLDLTNISYISKDEHEKIYKRCKVQLGDILLTKDGANTGNCCLNTLDEEFSLLSSVAVLRGKKDSFNNNFILQILQSDLGQDTIISSMSGQAITRITLAKLKDYSFFFPELTEQTQITSFLSAVDEKISQLTQKHALLSQYKQGMMQKLFSQQIRFKADDGSEFGEWEETTLGALYNIGSSKRVLQEDWKSKGIPFLRTREIISLIDKTNFSSPIFIAEKLYDELTNKYGAIKENDILVSGVGTVGKAYIVKASDKFYFKDGNVIWLRSKELNNSRFIYYFFQSHIMENYFVSNKSITTVDTFTIDQAKKVKLLNPSIEEQTKIANFLSIIDQKIEVVAQQIEQAKTWKKGLLQQMFV